MLKNVLIILSLFLILGLITYFAFIYFKKKRIEKIFFNMNIKVLDRLSGADFENLMCCFFKNLGFAVKSTKKSHDYGADLILNIDNSTIVLQAKLYYEHTVGNKSVQEAYTAKDFYKTNYAMVVTNSKFSKPAIEMAERLKVILLDREKLSALFKMSKPNQQKYISNLIIDMFNSSK